MATQTIVYNEVFERDIISERPNLFDEDGYEMDSEDDEDGEALAAANEFYPYNDVRIEGQNCSSIYSRGVPNKLQNYLRH